MLALELEYHGCISAEGLQPPETCLGDTGRSFWTDTEEDVWLGLVKKSSCFKQPDEHVMSTRYCLPFPSSLVLS